MNLMYFQSLVIGLPMDWLLIFLLLPSDLTSAVDNPYLQNDTEVCTGRQARFRWNYDVKSFATVVWNHEGKKIASSLSLTFSPEVIISDQFKGRLTFNSTDPFSFTLENATKVDNGEYECVFHFDDGSTDHLIGMLKVKDLRKDDSMVKEVEKNDSCFTLSCRADHPCTWIYPNGTKKVAKEIRYCSEKVNETIKCESDHDCKYAKYTRCAESNFKRRRSKHDKFCARDDSNRDGAHPGTDPINPVPIVLGVLAAIIAIAVITVIIVFYKRRSRQHGVQGPPVHYEPTPVEDNQDM